MNNKLLNELNKTIDELAELREPITEETAPDPFADLPTDARAYVAEYSTRMHHKGS